ncbi:MAG: RluA family pseudouridine synthase [Brevinematales bacterium]|nr:RluA family pseudouridine synthase [Brevinematales bacterium]
MKIVCSKYDEGHRVDVVISKYVPFTRSQIKSKISTVYVNGQIRNFGYKVKFGDVIEFEDIQPEKTYLEPEPISIEIIYQDEDIAVVNKPYNMVVHPAPGHWSGTLVNAILYNLKDRLSTVGGYIRPGIVHRLDKETSGIIVIALNDKSHFRLSSFFKNRLVHKEYWALVCGKISERNFVIDKPIGRNPKNRHKMAIVLDGREAITEFEVIDCNEEFSLVVARPITGRTHQIRVHLKSINHPIVADPLYGVNIREHKVKFNIPDGFIPLTSRKIVFPHPNQDKMMVFEIDLPIEFKDLIQKVGLRNFKVSQ